MTVMYNITILGQFVVGSTLDACGQGDRYELIRVQLQNHTGQYGPFKPDISV